MTPRTIVRNVVLILAAAAYRSELIGKSGPELPAPVFALFDVAAPESAPFPTDIFTVEDASHNTGRRLAHPYPDCTRRPSDCDDLDVLNTLDGWGLQTRVSVPFSGDIDPGTVTSESVFVVSLGSTVSGNPPGGGRINIDDTASSSPRMSSTLGENPSRRQRRSRITQSPLRSGTRLSFERRWRRHTRSAFLRDTSSPPACSRRKRSHQ